MKVIISEIDTPKEALLATGLSAWLEGMGITCESSVQNIFAMDREKLAPNVAEPIIRANSGIKVVEKEVKRKYKKRVKKYARTKEGVCTSRCDNQTTCIGRFSRGRTYSC
jgi:hypothetical protein